MLCINDPLLVINGFLVYGLKHTQDKFFTKPVTFSFENHLPEDAVPASGLKYRHVPLFLELTNAI
jgi:hypothetical protein